MQTRPFIHDDFLLSTPAARRLYHEFAEPEPILDYHCHLSPRDLAENRQFKNLFEIWLEGDHYKWRAMRSNGVPEHFCTGDATPLEKFKAWAATVPHTLRNPLYHWTQLELARYFGVSELLNESSAERVWERANEQLATPEFSTQGILKKFRVTTPAQQTIPRTICVTTQRLRAVESRQRRTARPDDPQHLPRERRAVSASAIRRARPPMSAPCAMT